MITIICYYVCCYFSNHGIIDVMSSYRIY